MICELFQYKREKRIRKARYQRKMTPKDPIKQRKENRILEIWLLVKVLQRTKLIEHTHAHTRARAHTHTERMGFHQWLIICGPAGPAMAVYQWEIQEWTSCLLHQAGCLNWSSLYTRILKKQALTPVKEWTCQQKARKQEQKFLSCTSLQRLPSEDLAQIKGGSYHLKRFRLKVGLST